MHRQLLLGLAVGSYPALLLLALIAGYLLLRWRSVRLGIAGGKIDTLALCVAGLSLLGARLFSWWFYFPSGASLWDALTNRGAGMVFYGGLLFGIGTVLAYAWVRRPDRVKLLDACGPAL